MWTTTAGSCASSRGIRRASLRLPRIGPADRRGVAVVERRRAVADQRAVHEARPAALVELGLGGRERLRATRKLCNRERERLGRHHATLDPDAHAAGGGCLPAMGGGDRKSTRLN